MVIFKGVVGMAVYRPIQKRLLIHDILYKEKVEDSFEGVKYKEPVLIKNVRVEPTDKLIMTDNNKQIVSNTLVFIDSFYTLPDIRDTIKNEDIIIFEGREVIVKGVDRLYDNTRLHHLEVWGVG